MILPSTYYGTLALVVLSLLCWGSWASLYKAAGKWRFELFYFDFAIGAGLTSILNAVTFGTLGFDGFSFMDDVLHASKKQDIAGFFAGFVFNLGNMLLFASVAENGMAVAFPIGLGVALVVGAVWNFFVKPGQNAAVIFIGAAVTVCAVILCLVIYRAYKLTKIDELVRTGKQKSTRKRVSLKGAALAAFGGLVLGSYFPLVTRSMEGEAGVGPYTIGVLFAAGIFVSTFFYNLFFMNLPVNGPPLEIFDYLKGSVRQHVFGILAGVVWFIGLGASFVAAAAEGKAAVAPAAVYAFSQSALLIAALWGILFWKEYRDADARVRAMLVIMLALFMCGIGLVAVAPVLGHV